MLTNIFLGLILGVIIGVIIILCSEIKRIKSTLNYIADYLPNIDRTNLTNSNHIEHLLDKFNKRVLVDNEHFEIINSSINDKFKALNYNDDYIKDRLDAIGSNTQNLIMEEHKYTRNEIKKKAKISSKIKSNPKTNKSINNK